MRFGLVLVASFTVLAGRPTPIAEVRDGLSGNGTPKHISPRDELVQPPGASETQHGPASRIPTSHATRMIGSSRR